MGGGGALDPPPVVFCPLLKKSSGNQYLKILDFSQLFIADAPIRRGYKISVRGGGEIFKEQNFFQELGTKFKKKGTKLT